MPPIFTICRRVYAVERHCFHEAFTLLPLDAFSAIMPPGRLLLPPASCFDVFTAAHYALVMRWRAYVARHVAMPFTYGASAEIFAMR